MQIALTRNIRTRPILWVAPILKECTLLRWRGFPTLPPCIQNFPQSHSVFRFLSVLWNKSGFGILLLSKIISNQAIGDLLLIFPTMPKSGVKFHSFHSKSGKWQILWMAVNLNHNWVLGGFSNAFVQSYYEILLWLSESGFSGLFGRGEVGKPRQQHMEYVVIFEEDENGCSAYVPDLPGCIAAGETVEEVRELIAETIDFHWLKHFS